MLYWAIVPAACLLSLERITYWWVSHRPAAWRAFSGHPALAWLGGPVDVLHACFYGFKAIQLGVFLGWCVLFGGGPIPWPTASPVASVIGIFLIGTGSALSLAVFRRLGTTGVFYGRELGHEVVWVRGFPFSVLRHPQYIGTLFTIWGFFLVMRYPHPDWIVLPLLETAFYAIGAWAEP